MAVKAKLSPPWIEFYKQIEVLFKDDPAVRIEYDDEEYVIKLYVDGALKAEALTALLPAEKQFGNITVKVTVIPANILKDDKVALFKAAFEGNPAFSFAWTASGIFANDLSYIVFKNKVVQYFNDDLGDVNGNRSTLYQEIAKEIFGPQDGIFFCTDAPEIDLENSVGKPLGEWP